jgi:hypothetical protein
VVYEQLVDDCTAAEEFVHTMLQQKGYRESDNREFFRAPVSEVIQIIIKMPTQFSSNSGFEDDEDAEFFSSESNDELDEFVLDDDEDEEEPDYPWLALWEMAKNYYYGFDDYIQDYDEAMKLYKQAIKLGCLVAYEQIGNMYRYGESVPKNTKKALEWYKEGVKKGNYYCYSGMGYVFGESSQFDNVHKCFKLLLTNRNEQTNDIVEKFSGKFQLYCRGYLALLITNDLEPSKEMLEEILKNKDYLVDEMNEYAERDVQLSAAILQDIDDPDDFKNYMRKLKIASWQKILKLIEENL